MITHLFHEYPSKEVSKNIFCEKSHLGSRVTINMSSVLLFIRSNRVFSVPLKHRYNQYWVHAVPDQSTDKLRRTRVLFANVINKFCFHFFDPVMIADCVFIRDIETCDGFRRLLWGLYWVTACMAVKTVDEILAKHKMTNCATWMVLSRGLLGVIRTVSMWRIQIRRENFPSGKIRFLKINRPEKSFFHPHNFSVTGQKCNSPKPPLTAFTASTSLSSLCPPTSNSAPQWTGTGYTSPCAHSHH